MFTIQRSASLMMLSTAIAFAPVTTSAAELPSACEASGGPTPRILLAQDQVRHGEGRVGETHCYRLDLETAGLLHLDVATAGALVSGARLEVFETKDSAARPARLRPLARTATERLTLAAAGTYFLEIRAEDPRRPLPAYRLGSRFVEMSKSETDGELELETDKSETDGELELETDKSETDGELELETDKSETDGELELETDKSETDGELELETDKSETDGELELETDKFADSDRIRALLEHLCATDGVDDHSDNFACATALEHRATGELTNGWGDDADVFRFEVTHWQTVEITAKGDVDTHGTLFDRRGQRLAADDDQGEGEGFRLVRTLGPGTYFVRVEGMGSEGSYALAVHDLDR